MVDYSASAAKQLVQILEYIADDSLANSVKVRNTITAKLYEASTQPYKHAADKYRMKNDGSFRAFEVYKYRIAYKIFDQSILVISIRHTSQKPNKY